MGKDVIIALDFDSREKTLAFLDRFQDEKPFVKVGMELFYAEGPDIVRQIRARGHRIFLDLKLHDIPNTVKKAMAALSALDVDIINLHAAGTKAMMSAALEGLTRPDGTRPLLIAVTQLTSTDQERMEQELLIHAPIDEVVLHYARNARDAGLDGVVCSPLEAGSIHARCGADFLTVTPGVRFADGETRSASRRRSAPGRSARTTSSSAARSRRRTIPSPPIAGAWPRSSAERRVRDISTGGTAMDIKHEVARSLLSIEAVFLRPQEPFTWASGIKSPIYCDNRLILTAPEARDLVERAIAETVRREYPQAQVLMGTATAGIAHAAIAAHLLGLPMGYVRSSSKDHGRQNRIEGKLVPGQKVVVVEDLISTGGSVLDAVDALREAGAEVLGVVSIFTYGMKKGVERLAAAQVRNVSLTDLDTVASTGAQEGYITEADVARLLAFRENPSDESWIRAESQV